MSAVFPALRVGEPLSHESLSVFPLFCDEARPVEYRLSEEALADESVDVEEISEGGSVPDLLVDNKGALRVLFIEGQELVGAKQNRILNTSVLVAARTKMKIPVSCVEQGRWAYKSKKFAAGVAHSPSKLRRALKSSVSRSVREKRGHRSDQGAVWESVAASLDSAAVESPTMAMSDAYTTYQDRLAELARRMQYVEGATGLAVAVGDRVLSLDVFDQPATCRKVWDKLVSGVLFDALESPPSEKPAARSDVERLLAGLHDLPWERSDAVGEGAEYRTESPQGEVASALVLDEALVHGSVVAGG